jgi:hypothetical protein
MTTTVSLAYRGVWKLLGALVLGLALESFRVVAFPPALPHTLYGMVRDELGNPLNEGASIILESASGVKVFGVVSGLLEPGVNYRLAVPLDAGLTGEAYRPTALNPRAPFKIRVKIGARTYLPIEMSRNFSQLGEPGKRTLLNLTLGVDSDGDGIPDAWERNLIAATGGKRTLADINPGDDTDGDGLSNLQEYLAGTYAFDPEDGFALAIRSVNGGRSTLEFTAIRGRSYTIQASADMQSWTAVPFKLSTDAATVAARDVYVSTDVRPIRALAGPFAEGEAEPRFFKLIVH